MTYKTRLSALATTIILATPAFAQTAADTEPAPEVTETEEDDRIMETVRVVGTDQSRYVVGSNDALGLDLDFLENPRNVTVIPEQLVLDRKITTLEEALRNVPGVVAGDGFGGTRDDFFIRGFRRNSEFRNGFRRASVYKANLSNIEYTQVIRGPAAITFGQVEPGGVVDVVTKRPLDSQRISGELRAGSFNDYFGLLDISQPINDQLAIRLVGSLQDAESFRDFTEIQRNTFAITADFDLTPKTLLKFGYEYRDESRPLDRGTAFINVPDGPDRLVNDVADVPFSRRFGDPWEIGEVELNLYEAGVEHEFNDSWSLDINLAYEDSFGGDKQSRPRAIFALDADDPNLTPDGFFTPAFFASIPEGVDPAAAINAFVGAATANAFDDPTDQIFLAKGADGNRFRDTQAFYANAVVTGEIQTGALNHRVSIGADYRDAEQTTRGGVGPATDGVTIGFLNVLDPVYTLPDDLTVSDITRNFGPDEDVGVFANSYTEVGDRLGVLLGIRYSEVEDRTQLPDFGIDRSANSSGWSPQAGLTFKAADNVSLYASYAESFTPNNVVPPNPVTGAGPREIDPEEGEQIEAGVKAEFFAGKLQTSAAIYAIEKVNVFQGVDVDDNPIFADGQTSEGVELSVAGQPIPGMNLTAAYAYIDADVDGSRPAGIPENMLNFYASYEVQSGQFEGLGFGGGYYYEGERTGRFGGAADQLFLGEIELVDASIWYTIAAPEAFGRTDGTIRFQLAAKNIFDEEYYLSGFNPLRIPLGTPRSVFGSVSFDF